MPASLEMNISSFLIRFIDATQQSDQVEAQYRGLIRHIQSGDEMTFTRWADATDFIQQFFPIEDQRSESDAGA
jgi:hypothetical protein